MSRFDGALEFKLSHIGVAVLSVSPTIEMLENLLGYRILSGPFYDSIQKVEVVFLTRSREDVIEIELIAPTSDDSPVSSMLAKGRGGAYHLCFETNDIEAALAHAHSSGCIIVAPPVPAIAFNNRRVAWIFTSSEQIFELLESKTPVI